MLFDDKMPTIEKTALGKPYFAPENGKSFSLSHSNGAMAVVLCDDGANVGIDIEARIDDEKFGRISTRFPFVKKRSSPRIGGEIALYKATPTEDGFAFDAIEKMPVEEPFGTIFWTETEALLKADGDGFAGSKRLDELERTHEISSYTFDEFYLSIAKQTEICK
jgi:phosphopantetheinyl transferase